MQKPKHVYFLPVSVLPGEMVDSLPLPQPRGPRHLVPAGSLGLWCHSALTCISEAIKSGTQVAEQHVAGPSP